jgi:hypothetical protein
MMESIVTLLCLVLYFNPARLVIQSWFGQESVSKKVGLFFTLTSTLIPLVVFYAGYFLKVSFTQLNILVVLIILNGILLFLTAFSNRAKQKARLFASEPQQNHLQRTLLLLGIVVFAYPYIVNNQPIIGGDSPHYLFNSTLLIKDGKPPIVFDRNIVYFLPAIGQVLSGISIENVLKIIVLGYELLFVSTSVFIAQKWLDTKLLIPFGVTMIFSLALYNLSKFTIPFFIALTIVLVISERIMSAKSNFEWLLVAYLWGVLFNLHGVIAFASIVVLSPLVGLRMFSQKASLLLVAMGVMLFICVSQPLIFSQASRLIEGLVVPIKQVVGLSKAGSLANSLPAWEKEATAVLVDEYTVTPPSISRFPLYLESFKNTYSSVVLIMAIMGLWIIMRESADSKRFEKSIVLWIVLNFFAFTQQEFIGINWFANRFVFALAPFILVGAFYTLQHFGRVIKKSEIAYYASLALIVLPTTMVGFEKITHLSANIKAEEYQFIQRIAKEHPQENIIFVAAGDDQWVQALAPQWRVYRAHYQAICGDESAKPYTEKSLWEVGEAFSQKVTLEQSVITFKKYSQRDDYLVYLDTKNYHCINGSLFPGPEYPLLAESDGLMLLKHK